MSLDWPLVGRRDELDVFRRALDDAQTGGICLVGAPGVGKTRLVREAVSAAAAEGLTTSLGSGTEAARGLPFGALSHLLPLAVLTRHPAPGPGWVNVIRVAAEAFLERVGDGRPVLAIDDAHLLDPSSATLAHHLAVTGQAFVMTSVRRGESAPDAVASLWKEGITERIEVRALSREELEQLLETVLGGQVGGATLHALWTRTRGNPLYLRELVLGGLEAGALVEQDGVWRWLGSSAVPRLAEVLEERLRRLDAEESSILEVVAAADVLSGGMFDQLVGAGVAERLERRGLLEERTDGSRRRVRLSHPLYGEVLRAHTPPARARQIRRQLADLLETAGARRKGDLLRLATWRLEGGGSGPPELFLAAARRAGAVSDFALAERLASAARQRGGGFNASILVAEATIAQGRFAEAEDILVSLAGQPATDAQVAHTIGLRSFNLFWRLCETEAAIELVAKAEVEVDDPDIRDQLRATRAGFLIFNGRNREGIDLIADLLERPELPPEMLAALAPVTWGLDIGGRGDTVVALLDRLESQVEESLRELALPLDPLLWLKGDRAAAYHFAGKLALAEAELGVLYRQSVERGTARIQAPLSWGLSWITRHQGRIRTAQRWLREAIALLHETDMFHQLPICLADRAQTEALLGELEDAERSIAEAESVSRPEFPMDRLSIGLGRAWTAAARGETSKGASIALETADEVGAMGQHTLEALALHDAARLGAADCSARRLSAVAPLVDGAITQAYAAHARALADADAAGLEEVAQRFESSGAHLFAAEAAAEAARVHREAGRKGSAMAWQTRAHALADRCEGARTPALAALDQPLPLTRREREVAVLAARGRSSREIAQLQTLSVRTVDNHLHNVYLKLGITGRTELVSIFEPDAGVGPASK
jgi:DNA-binding CsgD family transcriptional regulator